MRKVYVVETVRPPTVTEVEPALAVPTCVKLTPSSDCSMSKPVAVLGAVELSVHVNSMDEPDNVEADRFDGAAGG